MSDKAQSHAEFWKAVAELATMREQIPEERRVLSGVRRAVREDRIDRTEEP
jgi:hypothetical protein